VRSLLLEKHAMYKIGKAKLWKDGSGRVSIPVTLQTQSGRQQIRMLLNSADSKREDVWGKLRALCGSPDVQIPDGLDEKFALRVLAVADAARNNPEQMRKVAKAKKKAVKGVAKSRAALKRLILTKKEAAFKKAAQDLVARGATKRQLFQIIRDAIVEGIHSS